LPQTPAAGPITENHRDADVAERLADGLSRTGHNVSLDRRYLIPGHEWQRELRQALLAADGVIAVLSENSVGHDTKISSQWVAADIGAARATGKFLIPAIVGDDVPFPALVSDIYAVRLGSRSEQELERGVREIDDAVRAHMERRAKETALFLPPGYDHLASSVVRFREDTPYEESVFVMMKFPDPTTMEDRHCRLLTDIWEVISYVLSAYGLTAKRADKKSYQDQLWENVCVYMLGSKYGVAILEDKVGQELNPNVALEYGFMKALQREVALFRE
jgi:hypothetical protein